jgi:hypothetical protein
VEYDIGPGVLFGVVYLNFDDIVKAGDDFLSIFIF